jgi:hypothetical protein
MIPHPGIATRYNMRKVFFALLLFASALQARCQVTADPATGQMDIESLAGSSLNANFLAPNQTVRLKVPIYNLNQVIAIPTGGIRLRIALGLNMILDPTFNLATAPLSNYFTWTVATANGERIITGQQIAALPGDFTGIASFNVRGTPLGTSEIMTTIQLLNVIDEDVNNNEATLQYTVTNQTIPVNIVQWEVTKTGCTIRARFRTEQEQNLRQYEIEASTDNTNFRKMGQLPAKGDGWYQFDFTIPGIQANTSVQVRLKSVDNDGQFRYAETKLIKGLCGSEATGIQTYPNPVKQQAQLSITTSNTPWNGYYELSLYSTQGQWLKNDTLQCSNTRQIRYTVSNLAPGTYLLRINGGNMTKTSPAIAKFVVIH